MIKEERLVKIEEYVNACQFASIDALVDYIGVSKPTIRRDLNELFSRGKVNFVRGGASSIEPRPEKPALPFELPSADVGPAMLLKQRIAAEAAKLVKPGDTIFLCAGRTTREMVKHLRQMHHLKVVTNDFFIASELYACEGISVMISGGELRGAFGVPFTCGYAAEDFISKLRVNTVFLSCDSVDAQTGCYISSPHEVGMMREILAAANKHVVLASHEKFAQNAFVSICSIDDIDVLITDSDAPEDVRALLSKSGVNTVYV